MSDDDPVEAARLHWLGEAVHLVKDLDLDLNNMPADKLLRLAEWLGQDDPEARMPNRRDRLGQGGAA